LPDRQGPMKTLFISGTNTGIGKTVAAAWLCRELSESGKACAYVKAVQTGGIPTASGDLLSVDLEYVKKSAPKLKSTFCGDNFLLPASPHLSAAEESRPIDSQKLLRKIQSFSQEQELDFLIIEGAGGLAVPLNDETDMLDLCAELEAQLILVTTTGLGTLNHSFLSHNYANQKIQNPALTIINRCTDEKAIIEADNIMQIKKLGPHLATLPLLKDLDTEGELPLPKSFQAEFQQMDLL